MKNLAAVNGNSGIPSSINWTLADFLSTYRYWCLFVAALLIQSSGEALSMLLPLFMYEITGSMNAGAIDSSLFYLASQSGWVLGAFLSFMVLGRRAKVALIAPLIVCCVIALFLIWGKGGVSSLTFIAFAVSSGVVRGVFVFAAAVFMSEGKASRVDFACALVIMMAVVPASMAVIPIIQALMFPSSIGVQRLLWFFVVCHIMALLVLLPCKTFFFDRAPVYRHRPLSARQRSPWLVALLAALPLVAILITVVFTVPRVYLLPEGIFRGDSPVRFQVISLLALAAILLIAGVLYVGYWMYRIHGEQAAASPSQRLLTPRAAVFVALLAPFGLPVLLMTLGDILNDQAKEQGQPRVASMVALGFASLLFPPVAMALIQRAMNKK